MVDKSNYTYRQINHLFQIIEELEKCETPASARKYISTIIHLKDDIRVFFEMAYGQKDRFKHIFEIGDLKYRPLKIHEDKAMIFFNDFLDEFEYYKKGSPMRINIQRTKILTGLESMCCQDAELFYQMLTGNYYNEILTPNFIKAIFLDINIP